MHELSNSVERKFIDSIDISNLEIETDSGWQPISAIHKTVPYEVWQLQTSSGKTLRAADDHILFNQNNEQIFVKDLIENSSKIITVDGIETVTSICKLGHEENMFDITVDSDDHTYFTNGILSHNTAIINALSYALYGQALSNIKKDNLINKSNGKNMLVTLEFEKDGVEYTIERGRKPGVLKFFKDGKIDENLAQGENKNTQQEIEDTLNLTHTMFKHLVALNTYTEPFLSMRLNDQREAIEQLLGITLLSEKAVLLKEKIRETKDDILREETRIKALKDANDRIQKTINSLKIKQSAWKSKLQSDLASLTEAIEELKKIDIKTEIENHKKKEEQDALVNKIATLKAEVAAKTKRYDSVTKKIESLYVDLDHLYNEKCPTCEQKLEAHNHTQLIESTKASIAEYEDEQTNLKADIDTVSAELDLLSKDIDPVPDLFYSNIGEAYEHKSTLAHLIEALKEKKKEEDPYLDQITSLETSTQQVVDYDTLNNLTNTKNHQDFLLKLLVNRDSFIRKNIIDRNLGFLNTRLDHYLSEMGLVHKAEFQNDLTVSITDFGRELDFWNLSRGEMTRLTLALSFSFRDIWEHLYHNINLLVIDELMDNGLDTVGVENALRILKKQGRDNGKSIWLISHRDELIGRVNSILNVYKENGFTYYSNDQD